MENPIKELLNEGKQLRLKGRYAEAVDIFRRALGLAERMHGLEAPELISPLHALGIAVHLHNAADPSRLTEALELLTRALRINETHFGMDNPGQIPVLGRIGLTLREMERCVEAREYLTKALDISESVHGDRGHTDELLRDLADLLLYMNRHAEALPFAERALRIEERKSDDLAPVGIAFALVTLGRCYMGVGRNEEAIVCLERSLDLMRARHPGKKTRFEDEICGWIEALRKE